MTIPAAHHPVLCVLGAQMTYVQATQGGGGWPMNVFLTPDLQPFIGGTYWPPQDAYGRPGEPATVLPAWYPSSDYSDVTPSCQHDCNHCCPGRRWHVSMSEAVYQTVEPAGVASGRCLALIVKLCMPTTALGCAPVRWGWYISGNR